jgi:sugar phosphate isomerase/epimerase
MTRPLGLHQLTAMDVGPLELIEIAGTCGYSHVSLFTNAPTVPIAGQEGKFQFPTVTPELKGDVLARLGNLGLNVINAEFFLMRSDVDLETYRPGLALGRELGARNAMTHIFEPDPARAADILGRFCAIAAEEDMRVSIEFCQMTPGCKTIHAARDFVDAVGAANLGFGICPMHLVRSGGTAADIAALDPAILFYGQLNDGYGLHVAEAYFEEVHDRQLPSNGDFPLADILRALPASAPIEVKCPSDSRRKAGVSAVSYARDAYERAQTLLANL